jgi:ATP-binding cassette subfamily B protein
MGYMFTVHVPLTVACLATSPLLWYGAICFSRVVQPEYRRGSELVDRLIRTLVENFQGIHVVTGFARNMLVLIGYGGYLVIRGSMSLGAGLFVFAGLLHEFANQVSQIVNIANTIQSSLTGAGRVFEVLDAEAEIASRPDAARIVQPAGAIRFDQVHFEYRAGEPVLEDISFEVRPGECLGIAGETGAGKSTLLALVARFYDVNSGSVRVDGRDVRSLHLDDLRRMVAVVFQESFLFSNTVAANIAFGYPQASQAAIMQAAQRAAAHEFIEHLPAGYATIVGEYGANLSGGQRQRLAIARALLLDPRILLLDDATAAVDPETEHEIQAAIGEAAQRRTTLLVSNRVSALRQADHIIVLQQGRIVQRGTHEQLLRQAGYYQRLAELQSAESLPARRAAPEERVA